MGARVLLVMVVPCAAALFLETSQCNTMLKGVRILTDCRQRGLAHINFQFKAETEALDLSENEIERLRANQFRDAGLRYLHHLTLYQNIIQEVETAAFHGLPRLSHVDLSHNRISTLPPNLFITNVQLTTLQLSHNPLKHINDPLGTFRLQVLDLSSCSLGQVPRAILLESNDLASLNMADNHIKQVNTDMFKHLTALHALNIERNPITCTKEARQFNLWLMEVNIKSEQFCPYSQVPSNTIPTPVVPTWRVSPPPRHLTLANDVASYATPTTPWQEHWAFHIVGVILSTVNLIFIIILLVIVRRYRHEAKQLGTHEEPLPPYI